MFKVDSEGEDRVSINVVNNSWVFCQVPVGGAARYRGDNGNNVNWTKARKRAIGKANLIAKLLRGTIPSATVFADWLEEHDELQAANKLRKEFGNG